LVQDFAIKKLKSFS